MAPEELLKIPKAEAEALYLIAVLKDEVPFKTVTTGTRVTRTGRTVNVRGKRKLTAEEWFLDLRRDARNFIKLQKNRAIAEPITGPLIERAQQLASDLQVLFDDVAAAHKLLHNVRSNIEHEHIRLCVHYLDIRTA